MCFWLCVLLKRSPSYEHKLLILLGVLRSILIFCEHVMCDNGHSSMDLIFQNLTQKTK